MVIVFNPTAGRRRLGRLALLLDALQMRGLRPEVLATSGPGDAQRLAAQAVVQGARVVVGAGGDGTIAEVARGILGSGARLGIMPMGTANVLAHELALPRGAEALAAVLAGDTLRSLRPGLARFAGGDERLFVQMLGAGFDAAVVGALDLRLKRRLGRAAYVLQFLRELGRYSFPRLHVELDGVEYEAASVVISKGRFYAGHYLLAPAAQVDAPGFQVALFREGGAYRTALAGLALPLDLLPRMPGLSLHQAGRVTLATSAVPLQMDGDPAGQGRLSVVDAADPLPVLVASAPRSSLQ